MDNTNTAMTPLKYIMRELGIKATDWGKLDQSDKDDLKRMASDEMTALGIAFI